MPRIRSQEDFKSLPSEVCRARDSTVNNGRTITQPVKLLAVAPIVSYPRDLSKLAKYLNNRALRSDLGYISGRLDLIWIDLSSFICLQPGPGLTADSDQADQPQ